MTLQTEREAVCFICSILKNNCKIIKNQDSNDAICKKDFIKLVTENYEDYIQIMTIKEANEAWRLIESDGLIPVS